MSEQQKIQIDKFNKERAKQILKRMTPEQQDQLTSPQEKFKNLTLLNDVIESEILEKLSKKNNIDKNKLTKFFEKKVRENTNIINYNLGSSFNKHNNFIDFKSYVLQGFIDQGIESEIQDIGTISTEEIDYSIVKDTKSNKYGRLLEPYKDGFLIVLDENPKGPKFFSTYKAQSEGHMNILTPVMRILETSFYINYEIAKLSEKYIENGVTLYIVYTKAYKNRAFVIPLSRNKDFTNNFKVCIEQGEKEENKKSLQIYESLPSDIIERIAKMNGIFEVFNMLGDEYNDVSKNFQKEKMNSVSNLDLLKAGYIFSFVQKYTTAIQFIETLNKSEKLSKEDTENHKAASTLLESFKNLNTKEISKLLMSNLNDEYLMANNYVRDAKSILYSTRYNNQGGESPNRIQFTLNDFLENFIDLYYMHRYTKFGAELKSVGPIDLKNATQIDCLYYWKHSDLFHKSLDQIAPSDFPLFLEKGEVFNNNDLGKHIDEYRTAPGLKLRCHEHYNLDPTIKEKISLILNEAMSQETGLLIPYNACVELEDPVFKYARFIESDNYVHIFLHDNNDRYVSELFCKEEDEFRYWLVNRRQIFDEDDNLTNTFNHLYVKLASCIRDWKVLIERDRTMNFRGRRVPTGVKTTKPRYIYLPRVRYKTNPDREQVSREKVFYSESRKFSGERRAHIRRLPQGMKPSKTQLVIAQHNNITIPDNHTYVKESIWGKSKMNQRQIKYRTKSLNGLLYITNDLINHHKQIAEMSPAGFEEYCGEYIKKLGYEVYKRNNYDGGIDIRGIKKDGSRLFAQCKHPLESGNPVGPDVVRELKGSLDLERQDIEDCEVELMVITSTRYTHKACEAAQKLNIKLVRTDEME